MDLALQTVVNSAVMSVLYALIAIEFTLVLTPPLKHYVYSYSTSFFKDT
jgi:hypothetical protein